MRLTSKFIVLAIVVSATIYVFPREEKYVGVNLHGVNHTAETFSFYITDPENPETISGGSGLIDPYGAGGNTCCAMLPRIWIPGIKVKIHATHYPESPPDGKRVEIKEAINAEVPKYLDGQPGELWVLRMPDGHVEVVSSNYQPDHEKWPGRLKGWPVPSIEYRRQRWELYRQIEETDIRTFTKALEDLETSPIISAKEDWESMKSHRPQDLKGFSGPDDPLYVAERKASYARALEASKKTLQEILEAKP